MIAKVAIAVVGGFLGWIYTRIKPPPPRVCGSPGGPPITSPRIQLNDGRHLSYREWGVSKDKSKYKIIVIHGFDSSKDMKLPISQELIEELQIYFLSFDRAGYGESDPHPKRSVKSEAFDVQELADKLQIGSKFYIIGLSMGAYAVWSCLRYIPHRHSFYHHLNLISLLISTISYIHKKNKNKIMVAFRLSGVSLVVPFVDYWWPCLPSELAKEVFELLLVQDRWTFRVAHYAPWLFHWWMNQKLFPSLSIMAGNMNIFCQPDLEFLKNLPPNPDDNTQEKTRQQGVYESLYRDIMAGYGKWEFDPMDITNPWPDNNGAVHIWQGFEDKIIPYKVNRFLSEKIPFIRYHEVKGKGHFLPFESSICEEIFRTLLVG